MNNRSKFEIPEEDLTTLTEEEELLVERLVDGELSDSERQEILLRLDECVDGWRYCALSFLEAQAIRTALKNDFPACRSIASASIEAAPSIVRSPSRTSRYSYVNSVVSAAAGFLVAAISIGTFLQNSPRPAENVPQIANVPLKTHETEPTNVSSEPSNDAVSVAQDFAPLNALENANSSLLSDTVAPRTVVLNSPSLGLSGITTTCSEADAYDPRGFRNVNAVPQEVVNHMHNVGGSIDAHRDEYRFPLDNNRVLILPVDTYNVKTDGNQYIW